MTNTILVVGGTGMLGEPVARRLAADGFKVRLLARDPRKARAKFDETFEVVVGDVEKPETLPVALQGCSGVHVNLAGGPTPESYLRIEGQGTAHVARAAARAGVQHLTYLSGASTRPAHAWFAPCKGKLDAEEAIRQSGIPYSIFRASWFFESLPLFVQGKQAILIGKQPNPVHWLAADDYARMVSAAYQKSEAAKQTFFLYGPEAMPMLEALKRYCAAVRPDVKARRLPIGLVRLAAKLAGDARLADVTDFLAYYEKVHEQDDPTPANRILGAPAITLEQWCAARS
ncbi:MAG: SDR family oxidoreductase [Chloroflexota bacterium]